MPGPMQPVEDEVLATCAAEPIHVPGAIQPHGVLLHLDDDATQVLAASGNTATLGLPEVRDLPTPLAVLLGAPACAKLRSGTWGPELPAPAAQSPTDLVTPAGPVDAILHRRGRALLLEIFPPQPPMPPVDALLQDALLRLGSCATIQEVLDGAVHELRRLTGFDRVMAYRFGDDGHGEVAAEELRPGLQAYLGLRYPASDIPAQARKLYVEAGWREIPDARAPPIPLRAPDGAAPLDLGAALLRAVSPVHLEYMANMGLRASASVPLVLDGELWGLLMCGHEQGPRQVPHAVRGACVLVARLAAFQIGALRERGWREARLRIAPHLQALQEAIATHPDGGLAGLRAAPGPLLAVMGASAAAVVDSQVWRTGDAPPHEAVLEAAACAPEMGPAVQATRSLGAQAPGLAEHGAIASGLLSVRVPGTPARQVLWFRREWAHTVRWAGDPRKGATEATPGRLRPRRSFALWLEDVHGHSEPWGEEHVEAAHTLARALALRDTLDARREARLVQELDRLRSAFLNTAAHEVSTPVTPLRFAADTLRADPSPHVALRQAELVERSAQRLADLARGLQRAAKLHAGRVVLDLRPCDLGGLAKGACAARAEPARQAGVALAATAELVVPVMADPARLAEVVLELVDNALEASTAGSRVDACAFLRDGDAVLEVRDAGRGLDGAELASLFQPFSRTADPGPPGEARPGLGLYAAQAIAALHGGRIEAESPGRGRGTTVRLVLPAAPQGARS